MDIVHFHSWPEVLAYARSGAPIYYYAPLDRRPTQLTPGKHPYGYEVRARTVRIYPPGSFGRGRARTSDPFNADKGHLDRFARPALGIGNYRRTRSSRHGDVIEAPHYSVSTSAVQGAALQAIRAAELHARGRPQAETFLLFARRLYKDGDYEQAAKRAKDSLRYANRTRRSR